MGWLSDFQSDLRRHSEHGIASPASLMRTQGLWALLQYRVAHQYSHHAAARPALAVWRLAVETLTGISIDSEAEIGPSCYIGHFGGIFIGRGVRIGSRSNISQGVTIGVHRAGSPTIGDGCGIAPGAVVVGGITIGDRVYIGANAVVSVDVPSDSVVRAARVSISTVQPDEQRAGPSGEEG